MEKNATLSLVNDKLVEMMVYIKQNYHIRIRITGSNYLAALQRVKVFDLSRCLDPKLEGNSLPHVGVYNVIDYQAFNNKD